MTPQFRPRSQDRRVGSRCPPSHQAGFWGSGSPETGNTFRGMAVRQTFPFWDEVSSERGGPNVPDLGPLVPGGKVGENEWNTLLTKSAGAAKSRGRDEDAQYEGSKTAGLDLVRRLLRSHDHIR